MGRKEEEDIQILSRLISCEGKSDKNDTSCDKVKKRTGLRLEASKSTGDGGCIENKQPWFSRWKRALCLSERDKCVVKSQLSIWFPCPFEGPLCKTFMEVTSNAIRKIGSINLVKQNENLSESRRQRIYYRQKLTSGDRHFSPTDFFPRLPNLPVETVSNPSTTFISRDFVNKELQKPTKKGKPGGNFRNTGKTEEALGSVKSKLKQASKFSQKDIHFLDSHLNNVSYDGISSAHAEERGEGNVGLSKVPDWFIDFIESKPNLDLERSHQDPWEQHRTGQVIHSIELRATFDVAKGNKIVPSCVFVKEVICDSAKPTAHQSQCLREESTAGFQSSMRMKNKFQQKDSETIMKPRSHGLKIKGKPSISVSDHSLNSRSELFQGLLSDDRTPSFQHSWKAHRKQAKRTKKGIPTKRAGTLKEMQSTQSVQKFENEANDGPSLCSGDFVSSESLSQRVWENKDVTSESLPIQAHHRHIKRNAFFHIKELPIKRKKACPSNESIERQAFSYRHLNISNSSSNGVNRSSMYSRDYFSGNTISKGPYAMLPNSKETGKNKNQIKQDRRNSSNSPRKGSSASSTCNPESRRSIYAAYRNKYGEKASESSEEDSNTLNSHEEMANFMALMEIAQKRISIKDNRVPKEKSELPGEKLESRTGAKNRRSGKAHSAHKTTSRAKTKHEEREAMVHGEKIAGESLIAHDTEQRVGKSEISASPGHEESSLAIKTRDLAQSFAVQNSPRGSKDTDSKGMNQSSATRSNDMHSEVDRVSIQESAEQGDFGRNETAATDIEKNTTASQLHLHINAGEKMCGDFTYMTEKPTDLMDHQSFEGWVTPDKLPEAVLKEPFTQQLHPAKTREVHTVPPVQFAKEDGDGPDKNMHAKDSFTVADQLLVLEFSSDVTANAGGDEEGEGTPDVAQNAGMTKAATEAEGVAEEEKKTSEVSEQPAESENPNSEEKKMDSVCPDTLEECMRKWSRPKGYMPNLNPPCCISPCVKPCPVEINDMEASKTEDKEDSKAMKCNYTGFTEANKSELEALIDKHVAYLRCAQGDLAAIPRQTRFISSATDPYSQICKDIAFKTSAGLFNQTINRDKYSWCPEYCGASSSCKDPCPILPPLCNPPCYCPDPCPPKCCTDPCFKLPKLCCTPPKCINQCAPPSCLPKLPRICSSSSVCLDPCSKYPKPCCPDPRLKIDSFSRPCIERLKPCSPPPCCEDPCGRSLKPCSFRPCTSSPKPCSPPYSINPFTCLPKSCRSRLNCIDPCTGLPKSCSPRPSCIDPCTGLPKSCSPRPSCIDPCTGLPKSCSPRPSCIDPCTGLPKSCSPRPSCIDPCTGLPKSCSPRPSCIDPCTGLPKSCSPRPSCIDPCTGLPKSCSSLPRCIDPCTGLPKSCSSLPRCKDPCTGLRISCSPRPSCIDPCTGLPKSCSPPLKCADLCSSMPKLCNPYFPRQYRIDPVTQLPILCSSRDRPNPCFDPCDKISNISCNSVSDTKLSLSFNNDIQCSIPPLRSKPCPLPCARPCSESLSFCQKLLGTDRSFGKRQMAGTSSRRRSSSLDHFSSLQQRKDASRDMARKVQGMESKWSGIKQKACEVIKQIAKLQEEACRPKPQPCPILCQNACLSPICNPCPSPVCEPCTLYKCLPVCAEGAVNKSTSFSRTSLAHQAEGPCCQSPYVKPMTVCSECDRQTSTTCRSACNQTSDYARCCTTKCSTSLSQLNESSNKKCQAGCANPCAEISTCVGPSLMAPPPTRKRSRSEKKCTLIHIGKCEEGQQRESGGATDTSCCSTQAEGGKIAEIAKFVKECFDDSGVSTANRPIVKIRYNGHKRDSKNISNTMQDNQLKEQIAKVIKKGKDIQKKSSELQGTNPNCPRSRTVLRFKAGKNSTDQCEIYNVQIEGDNTPCCQTKKGSGSNGQEHPCPAESSNGSKVETKNLEKHGTVCVNSPPRLPPPDYTNTYCHEENPCSCQPLEEHQRVYVPADGNQCEEDCAPLSMPEHEGSNSQKDNNSSNLLNFQKSCYAPKCCHQNKSLAQANTNENANPKLQEIADVKREATEVLAKSERATAPSVSSEESSCPEAEKETLRYFTVDELIGSNDLCVSEAIQCGPKRNQQKCPLTLGTGFSHQPGTDCKLRNQGNRILAKQPDDQSRYYWSRNCKEIRKACLYLDDPLWEAYEYIEANISNLPTSYSSKASPLESNNLSDGNYRTKHTTKFQNNVNFIKKSNSSIDKRHLEDLCVPCFDKNSPERPFDRYGSFQSNGNESIEKELYEGGRRKQMCTSPLSEDHIDVPSEPSLKVLSEKPGSICQRQNSGLCARKAYRKQKAEQQFSHGENFHVTGVQAKRRLCKISEEIIDSQTSVAKEESGDGNAFVSETTKCKSNMCQHTRERIESLSESSDHTVIPSLSARQRAKQFKNHSRFTISSTHARGRQEALGVSEQESFETDNTIYCTEGSEGSSHGIEDLPLDTDSMTNVSLHTKSASCSCRKKLSFDIKHEFSNRSKKNTAERIRAVPNIEANGLKRCYLYHNSEGNSVTSQNITLTPNLRHIQGERSTVTSDSRVLYAGDYIEVCSSAPVQNKILTPRYSHDNNVRSDCIQSKDGREEWNVLGSRGKKSKETLRIRMFHLYDDNEFEKEEIKKSVRKCDLYKDADLPTEQVERDGFQQSELPLEKSSVRDIPAYHLKSHHDLHAQGDQVKQVNKSLRTSGHNFTTCLSEQKPALSVTNQKSCTLFDQSLPILLDKTVSYEERKNWHHTDLNRVLNVEELSQKNAMFELTNVGVSKMLPLSEKSLCGMQSESSDLKVPVPLIDHVDLIGQWSEKSPALFKHRLNASDADRKSSCPLLIYSATKDLKSTMPTMNPVVDAETMTQRRPQPRPVRDVAQQAPFEVTEPQKTGSGAQTMTTESTFLPAPKEAHGQVNGDGGGDAWQTFHVGCAQVTQASPRRVVLKGAYVQPQPSEMSSTSNNNTSQEENVRVIPFELVFLKTSGDNERLRVKGTYSRLRLDSRPSTMETWVFNA
ncbi:hypothetical protein PoB_001634200 [Plakobranchus ocellatus]|uniref:Uncharacterized protein n=1 Tax=Plakobranchus ocellatus TaxID=259542 RepID=A0AAV3Z3K5_9GAST|nr:hypothetical protein PoB_001634200 [Plakobranchus ocellatus]